MNRFRLILDDIQEMLSEQTARVEKMVQLGMSAFANDPKTAHEVQRLENEVNRQEVQIEEVCLRAIALFQPTAGDLRTVSTAMKANNELERIADLALNLVERAESLAQYEGFEAPEKLAEMVQYSLGMLKDADRSLATRDVNLARDVCRRDDQLDAMNRELIAASVECMMGKPEFISAQLHIFSASRIVERIGDHATNIAEDVLFLVEGTIQRHQFKFPEVGDSGVIASNQFQS